MSRPKPIKHVKWKKLNNSTWAAYWQRTVNTPEEQALFGGRTVITRYIGVVTERDADTRARHFDTIHDKRLAALRSLPKEQRTEIIASGGIDLLTKGTDTLARALDIFAQYPWGDPREQAQRLSAYRGKAKIAEHEGVPLATVAGQALFQHDMQKFEQEIRTRVERHKAIIAKVQPANEAASLDGLIPVWRKVNPNGDPRKYIASLARLKKQVGDVAWRALTRDQCRAWRDALVLEYRPGSPSPTKHLDNIKGLFRAARIEELISDDENPIKGVIVYGQTNGNVDDDDGRPFTGNQIKSILSKAQDAFDERWVWVIKLMAWAGLRPNEAAQIRCSDVYIKDGVPIIHVRVTLPTGQQMPLKKGSLRRLPIHPAIADFFDYAKSSETDFVFGDLTFYQEGGRCGPLIRTFPAFLRDTCEITTPEGERKLTLYSLRHSFHDAMRNCDPPIPEAMQRVLVGHGKRDSHDRYGKGAELSKLAKATKRINPLLLT